MGYISVLGACYACGRLFDFNPIHVPSIRVDGERQPICQACMERANRERVARGLEPFAIHPNAYEPEPEQNVPND